MKYLLKLEDRYGKDRLFWWDTEQPIDTPINTWLEMFDRYPKKAIASVAAAMGILVLMLILLVVTR